MAHAEEKIARFEEVAAAMMPDGEEPRGLGRLRRPRPQSAAPIVLYRWRPSFDGQYQTCGIDAAASIFEQLFRRKRPLLAVSASAVSPVCACHSGASASAIADVGPHCLPSQLRHGHTLHAWFDALSRLRAMPETFERDDAAKLLDDCRLPLTRLYRELDKRESAASPAEAKAGPLLRVDLTTPPSTEAICSQVCLLATVAIRHTCPHTSAASIDRSARSLSPPSSPRVHSLFVQPMDLLKIASCFSTAVDVRLLAECGCGAHNPESPQAIDVTVRGVDTLFSIPNGTVQMLRRTHYAPASLRMPTGPLRRVPHADGVGPHSYPAPPMAHRPMRMDEALQYTGEHKTFAPPSASASASASAASSAAAVEPATTDVYLATMLDSDIDPFDSADSDAADPDSAISPPDVLSTPSTMGGHAVDNAAAAADDDDVHMLDTPSASLSTDADAAANDVQMADGPPLASDGQLPLLEVSLLAAFAWTRKSGSLASAIRGGLAATCSRSTTLASHKLIDVYEPREGGRGRRPIGWFILHDMAHQFRYLNSTTMTQPFRLGAGGWPYRLTGVIMHETNHFTSLFLHERDNRWYVYDSMQTVVRRVPARSSSNENSFANYLKTAVALVFETDLDADSYALAEWDATGLNGSLYDLQMRAPPRPSIQEVFDAIWRASHQSIQLLLEVPMDFGLAAYCKSLTHWNANQPAERQLPRPVSFLDAANWHMLQSTHRFRWLTRHLVQGGDDGRSARGNLQLLVEDFKFRYDVGLFAFSLFRCIKQLAFTRATADAPSAMDIDMSAQVEKPEPCGLDIQRVEELMGKVRASMPMLNLDLRNSPTGAARGIPSVWELLPVLYATPHLVRTMIEAMRTLIGYIRTTPAGRSVLVDLRVPCKRDCTVRSASKREEPIDRRPLLERMRSVQLLAEHAIRDEATQCTFAVQRGRLATQIKEVKKTMELLYEAKSRAARITLELLKERESQLIVALRRLRGNHAAHMAKVDRLRAAYLRPDIDLVSMHMRPFCSQVICLACGGIPVGRLVDLSPPPPPLVIRLPAPPESSIPVPSPCLLAPSPATVSASAAPAATSRHANGSASGKRPRALSEAEREAEELSRFESMFGNGGSDPRAPRDGLLASLMELDDLQEADSEDDDLDDLDDEDGADALDDRRRLQFFNSTRLASSEMAPPPNHGPGVRLFALGSASMRTEERQSYVPSAEGHDEQEEDTEDTVVTLDKMGMSDDDEADVDPDQAESRRKRRKREALAAVDCRKMTTGDADERPVYDAKFSDDDIKAFVARNLARPGLRPMQSALDAGTLKVPSDVAARRQTAVYDSIRTRMFHAALMMPDVDQGVKLITAFHEQLDQIKASPQLDAQIPDEQLRRLPITAAEVMTTGEARDWTELPEFKARVTNPLEAAFAEARQPGSEVELTFAWRSNESPQTISTAVPAALDVLVNDILPAALALHVNWMKSALHPTDKVRTMPSTSHARRAARALTRVPSARVQRMEKAGKGLPSSHVRKIEKVGKVLLPSHLRTTETTGKKLPFSHGRRLTNTHLPHFFDLHAPFDMLGIDAAFKKLTGRLRNKPMASAASAASAASVASDTLDDPDDSAASAASVSRLDGTEELVGLLKRMTTVLAITNESLVGRINGLNAAPRACSPVVVDTSEPPWLAARHTGDTKSNDGWLPSRPSAAAAAAGISSTSASASASSNEAPEKPDLDLLEISNLDREVYGLLLQAMFHLARRAALRVFVQYARHPMSGIDEACRFVPYLEVLIEGETERTYTLIMQALARTHPLQHRLEPAPGDDHGPALLQGQNLITRGALECFLKMRPFDSIAATAARAAARIQAIDDVEADSQTHNHSLRFLLSVHVPGSDTNESVWRLMGRLARNRPTSIEAPKIAALQIANQLTRIQSRMWMDWFDMKIVPIKEAFALTAAEQQSVRGKFYEIGRLVMIEGVGKLLSELRAFPKVFQSGRFRPSLAPNLHLSSVDMWSSPTSFNAGHHGHVSSRTAALMLAFTSTLRLFFPSRLHEKGSSKPAEWELMRERDLGICTDLLRSKAMQTLCPADTLRSMSKNPDMCHALARSIGRFIGATHSTQPVLEMFMTRLWPRVVQSANRVLHEILLTGEHAKWLHSPKEIVKNYLLHVEDLLGIAAEALRHGCRTTKSSASASLPALAHFIMPHGHESKERFVDRLQQSLRDGHALLGAGRRLLGLDTAEVSFNLTSNPKRTVPVHNRDQADLRAPSTKDSFHRATPLTYAIAYDFAIEVIGEFFGAAKVYELFATVPAKTATVSGTTTPGVRSRLTEVECTVGWMERLVSFYPDGPLLWEDQVVTHKGASVPSFRPTFGRCLMLAVLLHRADSAPCKFHIRKVKRHPAHSSALDADGDVCMTPRGSL